MNETHWISKDPAVDSTAVGRRLSRWFVGYQHVGSHDVAIFQAPRINGGCMISSRENVEGAGPVCAHSKVVCR